MNSINHAKIVNDALHTLLIGEFKAVKCFPEFETKEMNRGEYVRYNLESYPVESHNSGGQTRIFNYSISYYFNHRKWSREILQDVLMDRIERLNQLFQTNVSYYGDAYKWHHNNFTVDAIDQLGEGYEHITDVSCSLEVYRFCEMPDTVYGRYGVTEYEEAVYYG